MRRRTGLIVTVLQFDMIEEDEGVSTVHVVLRSSNTSSPVFSFSDAFFSSLPGQMTSREADDEGTTFLSFIYTHTQTLTVTRQKKKINCA